MEITLNGNVTVTGVEARVCLDIATRQALGRKKYPTELALNRKSSAPVSSTLMRKHSTMPLT
jgi:hypothetical protein